MAPKPERLPTAVLLSKEETARIRWVCGAGVAIAIVTMLGLHFAPSGGVAMISTAVGSAYLGTAVRAVRNLLKM